MGVQEEFEELGENFAHALTNGDLEGVMGFFTEDALLLASGEPVARGRDEIRGIIAGWAESHPTREGYTTLACQIDGDVGWWAGKYSSERKNEDGSTEADNGNFLEVLRRQTDGSWKLQAVCLYPD